MQAFGILISPIFFFLVSKYFSNAIDKITIYHKNEDKWTRFWKTCKYYLLLGLPMAFVIYFGYTNILREKNFEYFSIAVISLLVSFFFIYLIRIISLLDWKMPEGKERIKNHRERIASFGYSIVATFLLSFTLIFCYYVLYDFETFFTIPPFGLDQIIVVMFLSGVLICLPSLLWEYLLRKIGVPEELKT